MTSQNAAARHITPQLNEPHLHTPTARSSRTYASHASSISGSASPPSTSGASPPTPPRSPSKYAGPALLPKIRKQDQTLDPIDIPTIYHAAPKYFSTTYPLSYDARFVGPDGRCRSLSPPDCSLVTPISAFTSSSEDCSPSPEYLVPSQSHAGHSRSLSAHPLHVRSKSTSFVDESARRTCLYPVGQVPTYYVTMTSAPPNAPFRVPYGIPTSMPQYMHHMHPQPLPQIIAPPQILAPPQQQPAPLQHSPLSAELLFDSYTESPPETTLLDYLSAPNPAPALVRSPSHQNRVTDMHFWWDVRNLVAWDDFNLDAVNRIPDLSQLLNLALPSPALPHPARPNAYPETLAGLHDMYTVQFGTRINAALKVSLGQPHLTMTAQKTSSQPGAPKQIPDFVANYPYDFTPPPATSSGQDQPTNPQARVVGIVRSYEMWNSGMRTSTPAARVAYLRELALLQHQMRSHGCRYGFIISEIELVCVRMGSLATVPVFGLLELAAPIQLATHGRPGTVPAGQHASSSQSLALVPSHPPPPAPSAGGLTVGLALWYLHMLAKNEPLPGQCHWRVDIGPPAALSRRTVLPKDGGWIGSMKPEGREKRDAKRNRGWVFPEDVLSRKEAGRPKRVVKRAEDRVER